jgi:hypothetical protein
LLITRPWLLAGDFNSVRFPHERSSFHMSTSEALFNDIIRDMAFQELPLLDRSFTWSKMQPPPIHSKLDRIFINAPWDEFWLDSSPLSPPRITSDHYPLKLVVSTNIPRPLVFRYYNVWKLKPSFKELGSSPWLSRPIHEDVVGSLISKLKSLREKVKIWKRSL